MKTPKTWEELLDAGYVTELTEEQVAIFKDRTGQLDPKPGFTLCPEEQSRINHENERLMRERGNK